MDWTTIPCAGRIIDGQRECPKRIKYLVMWEPTGDDGKWQEGDVTPTCTTHLGQAVEHRINRTGGELTKVAKLW